MPSSAETRTPTAMRWRASPRPRWGSPRPGSATQLRALLLTGDDTDRGASRGAWTKPNLTVLSRRRARTAETREDTVRRTEARRLAAAVLSLNADLAANKTLLTQIVTDTTA